MNVNSLEAVEEELNNTDELNWRVAHCWAATNHDVTQFGKSILFISHNAELMKIRQKRLPVCSLINGNEIKWYGPFCHKPSRLESIRACAISTCTAEYLYVQM